MGLRITTWNVNGIRNPFGYQPWRENKTFNAMFDILEADIVVMQELKIQRKDLTDEMVLVPGWDCYFSLPKHKKGYSGVGIYTRQSKCAPIRAEEGLLGMLNPPNSSTPYRNLSEDACIGGYPTLSQISKLGIEPSVLDAEGRCLVLEFPAFVLFGVYSPANSNGLRDDFRYGFICALDTRIRNLAKMGKRVVLTGDLNISREEIDTARSVEAMRKEGITQDEYLNSPNRRIFNQLLEGGKVPGERDIGREHPVLWDICRGFHEKRMGMYTHWEQKINARPGNFGSRIDYVICSMDIKSWFSESDIQEGLMGSDHCPVYAIIKDKVEIGKVEHSIVDIMNPPGMFKNAVRLRDFDPAKDLLPLSGKLLPEFDKRRSIKEMFNRTFTSKFTIPGSDSTVLHCDNDEYSGEFGLVEDDRTDELTRSCRTQASSRNLSAQGNVSVGKKRGWESIRPTQTVKRGRINSSSSSFEPRMKGQQSLKDFLKSPSQDRGVAYSKHNGRENGRSTSSSAPESGVTSVSGLNIPMDTPYEKDASMLPSILDSEDAQRVASSSAGEESAKESWTKLFSKKAVPRCEGHNEPCIALTTRKPGINCGRQFWICPRPLGPSGAKERDTEWRCRTFIWASDWNYSRTIEGQTSPTH